MKTHPPFWVLKSVPPEKVADFATELESFVDIVCADGADVVLASHANRIDKLNYGEECELVIAWRKQPRNLSEMCLLESEELANFVIMGIVKAEDIPVVDIAVLLPRSSKYFADYQHFLDEGARVVAQAMVPVVLELSDDLVASIDGM